MDGAVRDAGVVARRCPVTLKELQKLLMQEKFDAKGVQLYARDGESCRYVTEFTIEDSGGYFTLGEESNPQADLVRDFSDE